MPWRRIGAVVAGFMAWWVVVILTSRGIKLGWPAYAAAEPVMRFTTAMLMARLIMGALATLAAGWVTHRLAPGSRAAALGLGLLFLAFFIPVHIGLFAVFPLWYHLAFLGSLLPLASSSWWFSIRRN